MGTSFVSDTFLMSHFCFPVSNNNFRSDVNSSISRLNLLQDQQTHFDAKVYPKISDFKYWLACAVIVLYVRGILERNVLSPLGKRLGIKGRDRSQMMGNRTMDGSKTETLESYYKSVKSKKLQHEDILALSKQTDMATRDIERWLRKRRAVDNPTKLTKFTESGWRFIAYVLSTSFGFYALWSKPWFWDFSECWRNFPDQSIDNDVWWYFTYGGGFYCSLLISQAYDVKRKDFKEMFVHHVATISLMVLGWTFNLTRMGLLVLLLHDCADVFIEAAKMANYSKNDNLATGIFVVFTVVWIVTRLVILPFKIVPEVWSSIFVGMPAIFAYTMMTFLLTLIALHIFWTYFILKIAIAAVTPNTKLKDSRSSSEFESSDNESQVTSLEQDINLKPYLDGKLHKRFSLQEDSFLVSNLKSTKQAFIRKISMEISQ